MRSPACLLKIGHVPGVGSYRDVIFFGIRRKYDGFFGRKRRIRTRRPSEQRNPPSFVSDVTGILEISFLDDFNGCVVDFGYLDQRESGLVRPRTENLRNAGGKDAVVVVHDQLHVIE
jgi:hypothetical protein